MEGTPSAAGLLRRIRRTADMSQRELAEVCGVPQSAVAQAESGRRQLTVGLLARAAAVAGLRLALVHDRVDDRVDDRVPDRDGEAGDVAAMDDRAVRDAGGRRFPAHLDTRYSEEAWWHGPERYSRAQPWYTFDRRRDVRDEHRRLDGTPADHQLPQQGDSPEERRAARRRAALERTRARALAGPGSPIPPWICDCPPGCAELEDWSGPPRHTEDCSCRCDPC